MRRSWWFVVGELHGSRHLLVLLPRRGDESPAGVGCSQHTYQHTLLLLKAPPRSPLSVTSTERSIPHLWPQAITSQTAIFTQPSSTNNCRKPGGGREDVRGGLTATAAAAALPTAAVAHS